MAATSVKAFLPKDRYSIATGFLGCMFLLLGLIGVQSLTEHKRISESRAAGLAPYNSALGGWLQKGVTRQELRAGIVAGELGGNREEDKEGYSQSADRKIVRKVTLNIFVSDPDRANQELQQMARELGGYIVTSEREDAAYGRGVLTIT